MALTEYEERVIAELETQLPADDTTSFNAAWFERFETPPRMPRPNRGQLAPLFACLLGGVALLVASSHASFAVHVSDASGFSSSSIARTLGVIGCAMVLGSALMLWRLVRVPHHPR
jgi:hypothetical protein